MDLRWVKLAPKVRHDGARWFCWPQPLRFGDGLGSIFNSLLNESWDKIQSVKTDNTPSLSKVFGVPGSSLGSTLGSVLKGVGSKTMFF